MPPPRIDGDGPEHPRDDTPIVDAIRSLTALQEPARNTHTRVRALLDTPNLVPEDRLRTHLGAIATSCELLGPATDRAIVDLVDLLGNGGQDVRV